MVEYAKLWIVIADGEHARLVAPREDRALETKQRFDSEHAHQRDSDLLSDRAGRVHESAAVARHGVALRTDPHDAEKARFAKAIGRWIRDAERRGAFEELVVVAPSHVLADIESEFDRPVAERLRGTLARDLTRVPDDELQPHLHEWILPPHRVL